MSFYKTIFQIEVISDGPVDELGLEGIVYQITEGDCSGALTLVSVEELDGKQVAQALLAQGSDPDFLLGEL